MKTKKRKKKTGETTLIPDKTDKRVGSIAVSTAGHDAGLLLVIVAGMDSDYVLVADGKTRKLAAPKKKKMQHLSILTSLSERETEKVRKGDCNDSFLRRAISAIDLEGLT